MQNTVLSVELLYDAGQSLEAVALGMLKVPELYMNFKVNMKDYSELQDDVFM